MLAEIGAGLSSLQAAFNITKGLNAANTQASVNEVKIELQQHIIEAQQALGAARDNEAAAAQRIRDLEQEIVRLEDWSAEKKRYQLKRFNPGTLAYALKPEMAEGDPPHYLCKHCYDKGQKSTLQATAALRMRYRVHHCPSCKNEYEIGGEATAPAVNEVAPDPPSAPEPYDRYRELRDE